MRISHQPTKTSNAKRFIKNFNKVGQKAICILDDIPFLLKNILPKSCESIGSFMLGGAGFIIFPIEIAEGISGFRKAYREYKSGNGHKFEMGTHLAKVVTGFLGIGVSCWLLIFTLIGVKVAAATFCVLVPATVTIISGIELMQKLHKFKQAKLSKDSVEISNAKRKVAFGTTYFTFSLGVTALALISTLSGLGVISLGIIPSVLLIATVVLALAIKIFEIVDRKHNFKFSNALKNLFNKDEAKEESNFEYTKVQDAPDSPKTSFSFFGRRKPFTKDEHSPDFAYSYSVT